MVYDPLQLVLMVLLGLVVGTYGAIVGAGGGFLIVPLMLLLFRTSPQHAVGTSMIIVALNAVSASLAYAREGRVDYQTGWRFALAALPGSVLGAYLSTYFNSGLFRMLFGLLLISLAAYLTLRSSQERTNGIAGGAGLPELLPANHCRRHIVDSQGRIFAYHYHERLGIGLSTLVGLFSSALGIGGGIIHMPLMVQLFCFPVHVAAATSTFILMVSAVTGSVSHLALGHVLLTPAVTIGAGVVAGAQVGARLSSRLHGPWIVRGLGLALAVVGLRLILG